MPGTAVTMARRDEVMRLKSVDLPMLGPAHEDDGWKPFGTLRCNAAPPGLRLAAIKAGGGAIERAGNGLTV